MGNDIYRSPEADLDPGSESNRGSGVKAVLVASLVDIVGTLVLGIVIVFVYAVVLSFGGISEDAIVQRLNDMDPLSVVSLTGIALGSLLTIYAGYLCARIVNHREYPTVTIFGLISAASGVVMGTGYYSPVENAGFVVLTLLCAYLGAWIHVKGHKRKAV